MAAIIPIWRLFVSVLIWINRTKGSAYIRFHTAQALSWQVLQTLLVLLIAIVNFGLVLLLMFSSQPLSENVLSTQIQFFLMLSPTFIASWFFILTGFWMAYKAFRGQLNHYPVVGKSVARFLQKG